MARAWGLMAGVMALAGAAAPASAQVSTAALTDACSVSDTLGFPTGEVDVDLDAESRLSEAANWAKLEQGRFLLVVAPPPGESVLGIARAQSASSYLLGIGMDGRNVGISNVDALFGRERTLYLGADEVVVMTCLGVLPQALPVPYVGYPVPATLPLP
jgi:hypothetical protein